MHRHCHAGLTNFWELLGPRRSGEKARHDTLVVPKQQECRAATIEAHRSAQLTAAYRLAKTETTHQAVMAQLASRPCNISVSRGMIIGNQVR